MASTTLASWATLSSAQCLIVQGQSRAGGNIHFPVAGALVSIRRYSSGAVRCIRSKKQFLQGHSLSAHPTGRADRFKMSAEPEVQETTKSPEGEDPEVSAYEKELKVGKFNIEDVQEKFAVRESGKFECNSCGFEYKPEEGDSNYPVARGTEFGSLPGDWQCPICGASKDSFVNKGVQLSGFVQNQGYGLGGNSLTSGQKSILIYGSLILFFCLFLAGYLLQ